jgi:uncharacterized protein (DUF362 family)
MQSSARFELRSTSMNSEVAICHRERIPETPNEYSRDAVLFVKDMIVEVLDRLGGIGSFVRRRSRVLLKVNAGFRGCPGVHTTDPRVVEALVQLIIDVSDPREIMIAENAAERHFLDETGVGATTLECFVSTGLEGVSKRTGAKLVPLEHDQHIEVEVPEAKVFSKFKVPRTVLEADTLVFIPHLKTHLATGVTLNLKLNQGVLPTQEKKRCHRSDLSQKLVDLLRVVRPHLSIIDGIWAQQGQGPTSPYEGDVVRDMNVIIAGRDPVAVDAVGSALMGFDPLEIKTTWIAFKEGLGQGDLNRISVLGAEIKRVSRVFKRPSLTLEGVFPNVAFHLGGACEGCISHLRMYLDYLHSLRLLEKLPEKIDVVVGHQAILRCLGNYVLVVGDCSTQHKERGMFIEGCCPLSRILWGLLDLISLMRCDVDELFSESN